MYQGSTTVVDARFVEVSLILGHQGRTLLIVLLVLLLVVDSHADSKVLTGLAAADVSRLVTIHQTGLFVVGSEDLLADHFIPFAMVAVIFPLDTTYDPRIGVIVDRDAGALDSDFILGAIEFL